MDTHTEIIQPVHKVTQLYRLVALLTPKKKQLLKINVYQISLANANLCTVLHKVFKESCVFIVLERRGCGSWMARKRKK